MKKKKNVRKSLVSKSLRKEASELLTAINNSPIPISIISMQEPVLHPWKPEDGVIMDSGEKIFERPPLPSCGAETESILEPEEPEPGEDGYEFSVEEIQAKNGILINDLRKFMREAGELPTGLGGTFNLQEWREKQDKKEILYAFSQLSFLEKLRILFGRNK